MRASSRVALAVVALASISQACTGQLSDPFEAREGKYVTREAAPSKTAADAAVDEEPVVGDASSCGLDLELAWMAEVPSSVYAAPVIHDLYSDGTKEVIVPGFVHFLDVMEGATGAKAAGWPANHKGTLHASPLTSFDCDLDGTLDIVVVTYNALIECYRDNGKRIASFQIPPLPVMRDWHVGMNADPVDHTHPYVGAGTDAHAPSEASAESPGQPADAQPPTRGDGGVPEGVSSSRRRALLQSNQQPLSQEAQDSFALFRDGDNDNGDGNDGNDGGDGGDAPLYADYDPESDGPLGDPYEDGGWGDKDWDYGDLGEGDDIRGVDGDVYAGEYDEAYDSYDYGDDYYHYDPDWNDTSDGASLHDSEWYDDFDDLDYDDYALHDLAEEEEDAAHVAVDAHVLCTPAAADVDGDGRLELVLAVTYLFDHGHYADPQHRRHRGLDEGVDVSNYLAGGVVVMSVQGAHMQTKWRQHLDLSTHHAEYQAHM